MHFFFSLHQSTTGELEAAAIGTTLLQSVESLTVTCQNQSISSSQQNIGMIIKHDCLSLLLLEK